MVDTRLPQSYRVDAAGWVNPAAEVAGSPGDAERAAASAVGMRPMPCQRTASELVNATVALAGRPASDSRVQLLRRGALLAMDWVHARSDATPVTHSYLPSPNLPEAVEEYAIAWQIAASPDAFMAPELRGIGRIVAHGVEAYLLWYCFPETPTLALFDRACADADVLALLGEVGGPSTTGHETFPELPGTKVAVNSAGEVVIR